MTVSGTIPAATYHVAANGNDSNNGSDGSPWKTIQRAANTAKAGDLVIVQPGRYDENVTVKQSSAEGQLLTLRGD